MKFSGNEVFGEENFVATLIWQKVFAPKNSAKHFSEDHDYILVYARNAEIWRPTLLPRSAEATSRYENPDNDPRGPWTSGDLTARNFYSDGQYEVTAPGGEKYTPSKGNYWRFSDDSFKRLMEENRVWWGNNNNSMPRLKRFLSEVKDGVVPQTLWLYKDVGHTQEAKKELIKFVHFEDTDNVLDTVKPTRMLKRILQVATKPDEQDIVLDFFGGSCSTAHAVLTQNFEDNGNRRFICIQLPEPLPKAEQKLKSLADIGKERIQNVIKQLNEDIKQEVDNHQKKLDLGFRVFKLTSSNFQSWSSDVSKKENLEKQLELHVDHVKHERSADDILYEILLKSGFPLSTKIETQKFGKKTVYSIAGGMLLVCLEDNLTLELIKHIAEQKPERVVCLDQGFANNDQLKANAVQIFRTNGIASFKTV